MANGKIAECKWQDCPYCKNKYGERHCKVEDWIKYNLKIDGNGDIRCGLFKESDNAAKV